MDEDTKVVIIGFSVLGLRSRLPNSHWRYHRSVLEERGGCHYIFEGIYLTGDDIWDEGQHRGNAGVMKLKTRTSAPTCLEGMGRWKDTVVAWKPSLGAGSCWLFGIILL
jgi:hypothetical protein